VHNMCIGGGWVNDGSQVHPLGSYPTDSEYPCAGCLVSIHLITEMTDLSRVKLIEPWSDDPEGFFRFLDDMYCVHDLRVQQVWLDARKNRRDTQRFLKRFNASSKSLYPIFMEWWKENGTKFRVTGRTNQVLVQDQGRIVA